MGWGMEDCAGNLGGKGSSIPAVSSHSYHVAVHPIFHLHNLFVSKILSNFFYFLIQIHLYFLPYILNTKSFLFLTYLYLSSLTFLTSFVFKISDLYLYGQNASILKNCTTCSVHFEYL